MQPACTNIIWIYNFVMRLTVFQVIKVVVLVFEMLSLSYKHAFIMTKH